MRTLMIEMKKCGLRSHSGRPLYKSGIEQMLGNPFYCGIIRVQRSGETFNGAHEPIITTALFERVQDIKSGKKVKKFTRHNHLYRGLFIEMFYNPVRKHVRNGMLSPVEFERQQILKAEGV